MIIKTPVFMLLCGDAGAGKTTLASKFPRPTILDIEQGSLQIDLDPSQRIQCDDIASVGKALSSYKGSKGSTLILDSLTELERFTREAICKADNRKTLAEVGGGFGKGSNLLALAFEDLLRALLKIRADGSHIVCICHGTITDFANPTGESFNAYAVDLSKRVQALYTRRADAVLYLAQSIKRLETTGQVGQSETRELVCTTGDGHTAKNRYGMPHRIAGDFKTLWAYLERFIP